MSKQVSVPGGGKCTLEIWDTAGQEKYRSIAPMYYKGSDIAIVCYDITNIDSYLVAQKWIDELCSYTNIHEKGVVIICGTKSDLEHAVPPEDVRQYASENGFYFIETSSKTGDKVDELFELIVSLIPEVVRPLVYKSKSFQLEDEVGQSEWKCC
jgi:Ras-related protein Rab-5C